MHTMLLPATVVSACESDSIRPTVSGGDWFGGRDREVRSRSLCVLLTRRRRQVRIGARSRDHRSQDRLVFFLAGSVLAYAPDPN